MRIRNLLRPPRLSVRDLLRAVLFLAGVAAYVPLWIEAGRIGWGSGDYAHVFTIPLIGGVIYFLTKPGEDRGDGSAALAYGLWALGAGLRAAGAVFDLPVVAGLGLPPLMIGATAALFGWTEGRRITFFALFLLFSL